MNILVVGDEPEMASALVRGLQEELLDVQLARDGRGALRLSDDCSFDVILLLTRLVLRAPQLTVLPFG